MASKFVILHEVDSGYEAVSSGHKTVEEVSSWITTNRDTLKPGRYFIAQVRGTFDVEGPVAVVLPWIPPETKIESIKATTDVVQVEQPKAEIATIPFKPVKLTISNPEATPLDW